MTMATLLAVQTTVGRVAVADEGIVGGFSDLTPGEARFLIGVFETYIRLRDGIRPTPDPQARLQALASYLNAFEPTRRRNLDLIGGASNDCQRFLNLYNNVGLQLAFGYSRYLRARSTNAKTQAELGARARILGLLETALLSLVLMGAEGGRSELDPEMTSSCAPDTQRSDWADGIFKVHRSLLLLQDAVFGQLPSGVPDPQIGDMELWNKQYQGQKQTQRISLFAGELVVSVLGWEKFIAPYLRGTVQGLQLAPVGRFSRFLIAGLYAAGLVAMDQILSNSLGLNGDDTGQVTDESTISSWDRLISLGETFVASDIDSPPLYLAYLKLMSELKGEQVQGFLRENAEIFEIAEKIYGSVDAALSKIKEDYAHEQNSLYVGAGDTVLSPARPSR